MITTPYESLTALKHQLNLRTADLLVLAPANDPFFAGQPYQVKQAEWFARVWRESSCDGRTGIHIRRVHYRALSIARLTRPNGKPYENTNESVEDLNSASKSARYLGLVDPLAFDDRRNPDPQLYELARPTPAAPRWFAGSFAASEAFNLNTPDLTLPTWYATGYDYAAADEPYHLEVWIEKSTMNDVLLPICQREGVNLVTSIGFQSVTSAIAALRRVEQAGKPARILYISDFDPAGKGMPVSVARQLEFWMRERGYGSGADIRLKPICLTHDQVIRYDLPRIPIKESDRRRLGFEQRNGAGAVELDALEAVHPGELARIVRAEIAPYRDPTLRHRLRLANQAAYAAILPEQTRALEPFTPAVAELSNRWLAVAEAFREHVADLQRDTDALGTQLDRAALGITIDLPSRPEPQAAGDGDDADWLFDSRRKYFEQLAAYRAASGSCALPEEGAV